MALVNGLPDFVHFSEPREAVRLLHDGKSVLLEGRMESFQNVVDAYDYVRNTLGREVIFQAEDFSRFSDEEPMGQPFLGVPLGDGYVRLLMSYDPNLSRESVEIAYSDFLTNLATYEANPSDFYPAYHFLSTHPAFWSAAKTGEEIHWETDFGMGHDAPSVYLDEDNRVCVLLENGPYVGEMRDQHSIDTRIVTVADTFEQAVVEMAKKVHIYYDETGSEREIEPEQAEV